MAQGDSFAPTPLQFAVLRRRDGRGRGEIRARLWLQATAMPVGGVSSLEALPWPCPSPFLAPGETLGLVRRARQRRRLGVVTFLEALLRCPGCLPEEHLVWVASLASAVRLGVPGCHMRVVAMDMSIRGAMYSIIDASSATSSSSQASSCCSLADLLDTMDGECDDLVWLGVFVVL